MCVSVEKEARRIREEEVCVCVSVEKDARRIREEHPTGV